MTEPHLRHQGGGDPARSNSNDLKNEPDAPRKDNDFPDEPEQAVDESPQDKPDLDAMAAKLGTDTIETGEGLAAVPDRSDDAATDDVEDPRPIFAAAAGVALLIGLVFWRRQRRSRLTRIVETIDVFDVIT